MKFRMLLLTMLLPACINYTSQQHHLTDPEIAMVMRVTNLSEVREGELARTKATDTSVRDFGIMMVTEHTAQNNKAESELARVNVYSEDSNLSRQLDADSGLVTDRLRGLSGPAFDRAYIDRQVDAHQSLITLIDSTLMPIAKKKVVREQLTALRTLADKHLARARQIQSSLPR
jgi:putative membrane protein